MQLKSLLVIILASTTYAQIPAKDASPITGGVSIATAQPAPTDIAASLVSEASIRASSISSAASSQIASITSSLGSEASQVSSKLSSISSDIESKSSSLNSKVNPTSSATDNAAAPAQTGVMAIGALFGAGAIVANL